MRAAAVVFDAFGTLFELDVLRSRLGAIGMAERELEVWLARTQRDGMALSMTLTFRPMHDVAASALTTLIAELGNRPVQSNVDEVMASFAQLAPCKDARQMLLQLAEAGTPRAVLSDGSLETTRALLKHADLAELVDHVVSIDEVGRWKPAPETYRQVARALKLEPCQVLYVSAHPWDVQGAKAAGLFGVLLQRRGGHHQPAMPRPDLTIAGLAELAQIVLRVDP